MNNNIFIERVDELISCAIISGKDHIEIQCNKIGAKTLRMYYAQVGYTCRFIEKSDGSHVVKIILKEATYI